MTVGTVETKFIAKNGMKLVPLKISPKLELLFRPDYNIMESSANPFQPMVGIWTMQKVVSSNTGRWNFFK
jgi:hypothetical protein